MSIVYNDGLWYVADEEGNIIDLIDGSIDPITAMIIDSYRIEEEKKLDEDAEEI